MMARPASDARAPNRAASSFRLSESSGGVKRSPVGRDCGSACDVDGREIGRHVDLDQLEIIRLPDHVVRNAGRLADAGAGFDLDLVRNAVEAEFDPALQDVDEMAGHVVPMPAGLLDRLQDPDMLRPNLAAGRGGEP